MKFVPILLICFLLSNACAAQNVVDITIMKQLMTIIRDPEFEALPIEQQRRVFMAIYILLENYYEPKKVIEEDEYDDDENFFLQHPY